LLNSCNGEEKQSAKLVTDEKEQITKTSKKILGSLVFKKGQISCLNKFKLIF
jgi:hypothetical protein